MLMEALDETEEYCNKNAWLNEIYKFCKNWNTESVYQWQGAAAFTIEVNITCSSVNKQLVLGDNKKTRGNKMFSNCQIAPRKGLKMLMVGALFYLNIT